MLAAAHHHPMDDRVAFDGPTHTYVVDGLVACRSVTTAVSAAFPVFDADEVIARMRAGRRWTPAHPLHGMTDAEIKGIWRAKGSAASTNGTHLHDCIEQALNTADPTGPPYPPGRPEFASGFVRFYNGLPPTTQPFRAEWRIFDKKRRLAGTVDAVFSAGDGTYHLYDWKRTPNIEFDNQWRRAEKPLGHLPDAKGVRYSMQLNLYALILEANYDIVVSCMFLVAMHPDIPEGFTVIEVPRMTEEAMHVAAR